MIYSCLKRAAEFENTIKIWRHPIEQTSKQSQILRFGEATTIYIFDVNERDDRGFKLNHKKRLNSAFRKRFESGWGEILHNQTSFSIWFAPFDSTSRKFLEWEDFEFEFAS